jgi:hypothetical protein
MYLIPLNQLESVELVIHALKAAAGEADCTTCPAHRVCMKQCLSVAEGIERLLAEDVLPALDGLCEPAPAEPMAEPDRGGSHLKVIK